MRDLNNKASKRFRLKNRMNEDKDQIKRTVLESYNKILYERLSNLEEIKELLRNACNSIDDDVDNCDCLNLPRIMREIRLSNANISNQMLVRKSGKMRELDGGALAETNKGFRLYLSRPMKQGRKPSIHLEGHLLEDFAANHMPIFSTKEIDRKVSPDKKEKVRETNEGLLSQETRIDLSESQVLFLHPHDKVY